MIAQVSGWLQAQAGPADPALLLKSAKFLRITDSAVIAQTEPPSERLGELTYGRADGTTQIYLQEDPTTAPARQADDSTRIKANSLDSPLTGVFEAVRPLDHAGFCAFIVESIRSAHAELDGNARDIWFTGLYGASLAVSDAWYADISGIRIARERIRKFGDHFNTLVSVYPIGGSVHAPFSVSFSFRSS